MPKHGKKTSIKRPLTLNPDRFPAETRDAVKAAIKLQTEREAAIAAAPIPRAFIVRPVGQQSSAPPQPKPKQARGRKRDWDRAGIEQIAENIIETDGLPRTATLLIEKTADACKDAGIVADAGKTQFKQIVRSVYRRHKARKSRKLISDQDRKKRPSIRKK
jgi:hypothetical protein